MDRTGVRHSPYGNMMYYKCWALKMLACIFMHFMEQYYVICALTLDISTVQDKIYVTCMIPKCVQWSHIY